MKAAEMTAMQKMIFKAIKEHYKNTEGDFLTNEKPLEFISMELSPKRETVKCYNGTTLTHYEVLTRKSAKNLDDNLSIWDICMYSDGTLGVYYDGSGWMFKNHKGEMEIQKHY